MLLSSSSCVNNNPAQVPERRRQNIHDLPKEILQEILSRVSTKYVLRCRSVCRMWKDLTSTQYFGELHHHHHRNRSHSSDDFTVLVEEKIRPRKLIDDTWPIDETYFKLEKKQYLFDAWRGGGEKKINISPRPDYSYIDAYEDDDHGESPMYISGSSSGLVVLYHKMTLYKQFSRNFTIINPIFPDNKVKIKVSEDSRIIGQIFGAFFHPVLKEFCVLWGQTRQLQKGQRPAHRRLENTVVEGYKLLTLGPSQPCWKTLNNESTSYILKKRQQPRIELPNMGTLGVSSPIIVDDVLYWMVEERTQLGWPNPKFCEEAILGFDTKTEEFHLLPHPAPCSCCCEKNFDEEPFDDEEYRLELLKYYQTTMHLLDNYNNNKNRSGGRELSLCQFSNVNAQCVISIWIFIKEEIINPPPSSSRDPNMNKNVKGSWIKTHTVKLNHCDIVGPSHSQQLSSIDHPHAFRPVALMVDEELLLLRLIASGCLLVRNLKLGSCERFESKRGIDNNTPVGGICGTFMCAHTLTLMSITNSVQQKRSLARNKNSR